MEKYSGGGMIKKISALLLFLLWSPLAQAGVPCSLPFTLTNGTTADATQVMANYNAIISCLSNAAAAGANFDITSLNALTTPLSPAQGGSNIFIATTVTGGSANAQSVSATSPTGFALTNGWTVQAVIGTGLANTGSTTLTVGSLSALTVYKLSAAGPVVLGGAELQPGNPYLFAYLSALNSGAGGYILLNNIPGGSAGGSSLSPDSLINLGLSVSNASSALTLTLTQSSGSAPTAGSPVQICFRASTLTAGTVQCPTITATQSITIPSGATLGTSSGVAFRVWIGEEYNAGTPEMVVATCHTSTAIFPCSGWESSLKTTTTISSSATSAGVPYSTTGVTNDAIRIIGYCEYASGLTTAGTWASNCTTLQAMGAGVKRPGDVVQTVAPNLLTVATTTISSTSQATPTATNITATITPQFPADLIRIYAGYAISTSSDSVCSAAVWHGTTANVTFWGQAGLGGSGSQAFDSITNIGLDVPNQSGSTTYTVNGFVNNTPDCIIPTSQITNPGANFILEEIMGSLEPANDNEYLPLKLAG